MTAPNPAQELIGAVLNGRFRLVRLLGEGGMGAVYEADSLRNEGKRAIKLLHAEFIRDEMILQRFFAEARAVQALRHPHVAQVFEAVTAENGTPYLVMELLQGVPLDSYMASGEPIPVQLAATVVHGVLQALVMAHGARIIHRDLKPENLFLVRDARGSFTVKVLDFGIAKVMDAAGGMGTKTRTGVLLGTPGYMSPEQIRNAKTVDGRTDLWAVGVLFYEMLTGRQPFPADNDFSRLTAVLVEQLKPIEQIAPHLASFGPFFLRALAKDPAGRFQTAEEMRNALTAVVWGGQAAQAPSLVPAALLRPEAAVQAAPQGAPSTVSPGQPAGARPAHARPAATEPFEQPPSVQVRSNAPPTAPPATPPSPTQMSAQLDRPGPTHMSAVAPPGTPPVASYTPQVQVIEAPRLGGGAPWWLVVVIGLICIGIGFAVGLVMGRSRF